MIKRTLICVLLTGTLLSAIEQAANPEEPTNLTLAVELKNLEEKSKEKTLSVVLFNSPKTKRGKDLENILKKLQDSLKEFDFNFLQVPLKKSHDDVYSFSLYINGVRKQFKDPISSKALKEWLIEHHNASPLLKENTTEIEHTDNHYYVYVTESFKEENEEKLSHIAKLISPLKIFYGFNPDDLQSLLQDREVNSPLWVYRQYNNELLEIETEQDIRAIGDYITANEYKDYYTLNRDSLRLVSEFRNPALIFFTKGEEIAFLDKLKTMAKVYKDDLITIIVDIYQDDKLTNFIVNFMGITRLPSLRILDLSHGVERFAYKGKLNQEDVYTFIGDYVDNMVNAYKISETIPKTHREVSGIRKINSKGLEKIFHDINNNYLIYVHAENLTGKAPDYVLLNKLKKSLDINTHFNLVSIDFEKNDVGANYIEELPLFMLATKNNKLIDHTGDLSFEAVKTFLTDELPYLQFSESEPEITNV